MILLLELTVKIQRDNKVYALVPLLVTLKGTGVLIQWPPRWFSFPVPGSQSHDCMVRKVYIVGSFWPGSRQQIQRTENREVVVPPSLFQLSLERSSYFSLEGNAGVPACLLISVGDDDISRKTRHFPDVRTLSCFWAEIFSSDGCTLLKRSK